MHAVGKHFAAALIQTGLVAAMTFFAILHA